jgi:hypothetical protein
VKRSATAKGRVPSPRFSVGAPRYNVVVTESPRDEFPQQFVGDLMASWSR